MPSYFDNVCIIKSKELNVAYWNIDERTPVHMGNRWMVGKSELVFFHFSGVVLDNIELLSKWQNRYKLSDFPGLKMLFEGYRAKLTRIQHNSLFDSEYGYNHLSKRHVADLTFCRKCKHFLRLLNEKTT